MRRALTRRRRAIMTSEAGARHSGMIEVHCSPVGGNVTIIAHIAGR